GLSIGPVGTMVSIGRLVKGHWIAAQPHCSPRILGEGGSMTESFPVATTPAPGLHGVDWENRVDFDRLRDHRLSRVREQLEASELGAVLLFETSNIRYATSTHIGYWAFNKGERYALVTRTGRPRIW